MRLIAQTTFGSLKCAFNTVYTPLKNCWID